MRPVLRLPLQTRGALAARHPEVEVTRRRIIASGIDLSQIIRGKALNNPGYRVLTPPGGVPFEDAWPDDPAPFVEGIPRERQPMILGHEAAVSWPGSPSPGCHLCIVIL